MDDFGLPTPVTPPTPPVPQPETPVIITPKKKFPALAVAGALSLMLLIGGVVYLSRQLVQQKQTTESQAGTGECNQYPDEHECLTEGEDCKWDDGRPSGKKCYNYGGTGQCPAGTTKVCPTPPNVICCPAGKPSALAQCINEHRPVGIANQAQYCPDPNEAAFNQCACESTASPSPSPTPSPTPTPTPTPSPSPVVGLACVDLTKNIAAPKLNDTVEFTCTGSFSSANPVAQFRYSTDAGTTFGSAASVAFSGGQTSVPYSFKIDKTGEWEVQCRVCTDNTTTTCTAWGKAL